MAFGIDTFILHLDQITDFAWNEFKLWNGGRRVGDNVDGGGPVFAGRNFLGGNFIWGHAEATNAWTELAGQLGAPNPRPALPEDVTLTVPPIAPIQAPQSRQSATDERGFLYGALDAQVICRKIF